SGYFERFTARHPVFISGKGRKGKSLSQTSPHSRHGSRIRLYSPIRRTADNNDIEIRLSHFNDRHLDSPLFENDRARKILVAKNSRRRTFASRNYFSHSSVSG